MKSPYSQKVTDKKNENEQLSVSVFEDLEIAQRTQLPPSEALVARLNHLATRPPFCWINKYKDHLSGL